MPTRGRCVGRRPRLAREPRASAILAARVDGARPVHGRSTSGARARSSSAARRTASPTPGPATRSPRSACRCSASPTASTSRSPPRSCCTRRDASAATLDRADRATMTPMEHVRLRRHRCRPGRRGRRAQGSRARRVGRRSSTGAGSAARARTSAASRRSACSTRAERHWSGAALPLAAGIRAARLHGQPARRRRTSPTTRPTSRRSRPPAPSPIAATGRITGRGVVTVTHDGAIHEVQGRNIVVAVGSTSKVPPLEGLADADPWTNERRRWPASCPGASSSWAAARPAASSRRSMRGSASR